jgi:hypothetical protein
MRFFTSAKGRFARNAGILACTTLLATSSFAQLAIPQRVETDTTARALSPLDEGQGTFPGLFPALPSCLRRQHRVHSQNLSMYR